MQVGPVFVPHWVLRRKQVISSQNMGFHIIADFPIPSRAESFSPASEKDYTKSNRGGRCFLLGHPRPLLSPTILLPMLSTTHYGCHDISDRMVRYCVTVGLMRDSPLGAPLSIRRFVGIACLLSDISL